MFRKNNLLINSSYLFLCLFLAACGKEDTAENTQKTVVHTASTIAATNTTKKEVVSDLVKDKSIDKGTDKTVSQIEEIGWDKLIPADYNPDEVINKYIKKLEKLQDNDPEAMVLYGKIQAELDNAPVNMSLDGKTIKMPGFVAPLENNNGIISEFLLVPYFGACIHSPAPPMNQTVMIKADNGQGIKSENSNLPVWITGKLKAVEERTNIGAAGYRIENATIEPYEEDN